MNRRVSKSIMGASLFLILLVMFGAGVFWLRGVERFPGDERIFFWWIVRGYLVPVAAWTFLNAGAFGLPPIVGELEATGIVKPGVFWSSLPDVTRFLIPSYATIASMWTVVTLLWLVGVIWERVEDSEYREGWIAAWKRVGIFLPPLLVWVLWARIDFLGCHFILFAALILAFGIALPIVGRSPEKAPPPTYSVAQAKSKLGKYEDSEAEILKQLEQAPEDFQGWMMLAELLVDHFKDLAGARMTVAQLCAQDRIQPHERALAWNQLADWELKHGLDTAAARRALEQICVGDPGSRFDYLARQRIAHLPSANQLRERSAPKPIRVVVHEERLGLDGTPPGMKTPGPEPEQVAENLVRQLTDFPEDEDAREQLASLYADHYGRIDLAIEQVEILIGRPHQSANAIARWLNLIASWQIQKARDLGGARDTLRRIIELYPNRAVSEVARRRLDQLNTELNGQRPAKRIQLGRYQQNIGLNH